MIEKLLVILSYLVKDATLVMSASTSCSLHSNSSSCFPKSASIAWRRTTSFWSRKKMSVNHHHCEKLKALSLQGFERDITANQSYLSNEAQREPTSACSSSTPHTMNVISRVPILGQELESIPYLELNLTSKRTYKITLVYHSL